MRSRTARIVLIVVGVVAIAVGAVWTGQGANLIPGSFMTGDRTWLGIGLLVALGGILVLVYALRRPRSGS
jgi:hypothetical protein